MRDIDVRASMNWAGTREVQGHWAHGACAYRKLVDKTSPVAPFHWRIGLARSLLCLFGSY